MGWLRWLLILVAVPACGPYLRYETRPELALSSRPTCTQGPLVLRAQALGGRWGERLVVRAVSPRAVRGSYTLTAGDRTVSRGSWASMSSLPPAYAPNSTARVLTADAVADNARCVARPQPEQAIATGEFRPGAAQLEPAAAEPPAAASAWPEPPPAGHVGPPPPPAEPAQPLPAVLEPPAAPADLVVVAEPSPPPGVRDVPIVNWTTENRDPDHVADPAAGTALTVTLWSTEPNDLEGVVFFIEQARAVPNVSEAEWLRHLAEEKAKEKAEADERLREYQARTQARAEHCRTHLDDEDCWGKGGYAALRARQNAPRPPPPKPVPQQPPVVHAPQPHDPEGPPPPPQAEPRPAQPSPGADWVSGYWQWTGFAWLWLGGWWRVPEADRVAQRTVVAPEAPPPLLVEVLAPPPVSGALWIQGTWSWQVHVGRPDVWVWIPGTWRMAPRPGAQWRAARWLLTGAGVRLDPGGWR